jgi:hypothetical protein
MNRQDDDTVVNVVNNLTYGDSGNMAALIFILGSGRGKWLNSRHHQFNPKKNPTVGAEYKGLGGPQSWAGYSGEGKFIFYQP